MRWGGGQALHRRASKGAPRGLWIKLLGEVCKYMNFSGGAFCKLHWPTEITAGYVAALRTESFSQIGLLNEWVSAGTQGLSDSMTGHER